MNGTKQATPGRLAGAVVNGCRNVPHVFTDGRVGGARPLDELRQRRIGIADKPVPPFLSGAKNTLCFAVIPAERLERFLDWGRVNAAHQLADQLLLAAQRAVAANRLRGQHGFPQPVVEGNAVELLTTQVDQLFPQRLQCQVLSFLL